jgi:hypothetical protein
VKSIAIRLHPDSERAELLEPIQREDGSWIEAGFQFGGDPIPSKTWKALGYTPFHPRVARAACIHNDDYTRKQCPRRVADERFLANLLAGGVETEAANVMFFVVRECGSRIWKCDSEDMAKRDRRVQFERRRSEEAP